jgi:hypothetical protein
MKHACNRLNTVRFVNVWLAERYYLPLDHFIAADHCRRYHKNRNHYRCYTNTQSLLLLPFTMKTKLHGLREVISAPFYYVHALNKQQ